MRGGMFTPEFKRGCAELILDHGYTTQQAFKATDVGSTALRRWAGNYWQNVITESRPPA